MAVAICRSLKKSRGLRLGASGSPIKTGRCASVVSARIFDFAYPGSGSRSSNRNTTGECSPRPPGRPARRSRQPRAPSFPHVPQCPWIGLSANGTRSDAISLKLGSHYCPSPPVRLETQVAGKGGLAAALVNGIAGRPARTLLPAGRRSCCAAPFGLSKAPIPPTD